MCSPVLNSLKKRVYVSMHSEPRVQKARGFISEGARGSPLLYWQCRQQRPVISHTHGPGLDGRQAWENDPSSPAFEQKAVSYSPDTGDSCAWSETSPSEETTFVNPHASLRADVIVSSDFWVYVVNKCSVPSQRGTVWFLTFSSNLFLPCRNGIVLWDFMQRKIWIWISMCNLPTKFERSVWLKQPTPAGWL